MSTFSIQNMTPVPTKAGASQEITGNQFTSDFELPIYKQWTDFTIWWDATKKWLKLKSQNETNCVLNFTGTSSPNIIVNSTSNDLPYIEKITDNEMDKEFWLTSDIITAPDYLPPIDSTISGSGNIFINYFDSNGNILRIYNIDFWISLITQNPAFPVSPLSSININVTCIGTD